MTSRLKKGIKEMLPLGIENKLEWEQAQSLSRQIHELSHEFLRSLGLSHIWITKIYFDGRYLEMTNDLSWKEIMVSNGHYDDFMKICVESLETSPLDLQFWTWESQPNVKTEFSDKAHHQRTHSEIIFPTLHEDHYEIFSFGGAKRVQELCAGLPSLSEMRMFCIYLRENLFTSDFDKHLIFGKIGRSFPPPQSQQGYFNAPVPSTFSLFCNNQRAKLSRQELLCLGLSARGYGQKDVAQMMNLSPRTVEFHLNRIKAKFKKPSKSQLVTSFIKSPLAGIDPLRLLATSF